MVKDYTIKDLEDLYKRKLPLRVEDVKELTQFSIKEGFIDIVIRLLDSINNNIFSAVVRGEYQTNITMEYLLISTDDKLSKDFITDKVMGYTNLGYTVSYDEQKDTFNINWKNTND